MRFVPTLLAAALLGGCGGDEPPAPSDADAIALPDIAPGDDVAPTIVNAAAAPPEVAPAAGSARAAADIVRDYFERLGAGDAAAASLLWDGDAQGAAAVAEHLAAVGSFTAEIGEPGAIEAGAGQRYVTVPFRISPPLAEAAPVRGSVVLHRVAQIDGASADQLRWRIRSARFADQDPSAAGDDRMPAGTTARYRCSDGSQLVAEFDDEAGTVALRRDGERMAMLDQQRAASGIWYRGEGYDLRGKGDEATISAPDSLSLACTTD